MASAIDGVATLRAGGRELCRRQALSKPSFYFWRREIAARDREHRGDATGIHGETRRVIRMRRRQPAATPPFVPVRVVATRPGHDSAIDIRLTNGPRLGVRAGCDLPLLTQVIALLEGPPC